MDTIILRRAGQAWTATLFADGDVVDLGTFASDVEAEIVARRAWAAKTQESDATPPPPEIFRLTAHEDVDRVRADRESRRTLGERIVDLCRVEGGLTVDELAAQLGASTNVVKTTADRLVRPGILVRAGQGRLDPYRYHAPCRRVEIDIPEAVWRRAAWAAARDGITVEETMANYIASLAGG